MKTLTVICPGRVAGGVNLLLARSVAELQRANGYRLALVDFADGALRRLWTEAGVAFDFQEYLPGRRQVLGPTDGVLFSLLLGRLLDRRFELPGRTRLLAWSTAPQDAFKYLPTGFLFNRSSWETKRRVARWIHRAHAGRIHDFLTVGSARGGVVFMDGHNHEVAVKVFGPGPVPAIVPVCTAASLLPPRPVAPASRKAYWVGRLEDFKTEALLGFVRAVFARASRPCVDEVVVVGDGEDLPWIRERCAGLPVVFRGHLPLGELATELTASAAMVAGHGISILEAARLGIPALVVDGTYRPVPAERFRAEWLHRCPAGYVGQIASSWPQGRTLESCLHDLVKDPVMLGRAGYERWQDQHAPAVVARRLHAVLSEGDYTVDDFRASGAACPGWFGRAVDWTKENLGGRRY
jgi:hypothetical protein